MQWDFQTDRPIYTQIVEQIELRIVTGTYPPGERIPAVRELADEASVNPNTMQRALSALENSGLLHAQRTSGRFVTSDTAVIRALRDRLAQERVAHFLRAMGQLGFTRAEAAAFLETKEDTVNGTDPDL